MAHASLDRCSSGLRRLVRCGTSHGDVVGLPLSQDGSGGTHGENRRSKRCEFSRAGVGHVKDRCGKTASFETQSTTLTLIFWLLRVLCGQTGKRASEKVAAVLGTLQLYSNG